jgi:hypothetical protein
MPARVEDHDQHADLVPLRERQKAVDPLRKTFRVLLPEQVVKKDAHAVEAKRLRVAELAIDRRLVPRVRLPHLELIDRGARQEIAPPQPTVLLEPGIRFLRGPPAGAIRRVRGCARENDCERDDAAKEREGFFHEKLN